MGVDDGAGAGDALEDLLDLSEPHGGPSSSSSSSSSVRAFVVLCDVHLDRPSTLDNLSRLLRSYAEGEDSGMPAMPAVLVLMGAFSSTPFGQLEGDRDRFAARMDELARLLASVPQLRKAGTQVVLVPGPTDPGTSGALPRPALPAFFCRSLINNPKLPAVHLTSNPCRIRWYTQELLLFRCDLTNKLQRRSILAPSPADLDPSKHTLTTVVHQGHLCPLPLSVQPLYWEHDHALRLCPLPDVLILGESRERYEHTHLATGMQMLNPGPFHKDGRGDFLFYAPAVRSAQLCRVNEHDEDEEEEEEDEEAAVAGTSSHHTSGPPNGSAPASASRGTAASAAGSAAASAMRSAPASAARSSGSAARSAARSPGTAASAASPGAAGRSSGSAARGMLAAEDDEAADAAGLAAAEEAAETGPAPAGRGHMAADDGDAAAADAADEL